MAECRPISRQEACRRAQQVLVDNEERRQQVVRDEQAIRDREREQDARWWAEENGYDLVPKATSPTYEARDDD